MTVPQPAGGNVLVYSRVRDPEARERLRGLLDNLPGERVSATIYEVFTEDWDDGSWDEEVARMQELIDSATDTLIFWRVIDGKLMRTCIAGRFA
ncbi:MAG TPA: hypothetical protein VGF55_32785 [Gemmataceae bacterium]|jgi:hypothetical protein